MRNTICKRLINQLAEGKLPDHNQSHLEQLGGVCVSVCAGVMIATFDLAAPATLVRTAPRAKSRLAGTEMERPSGS